MKIVVVTFCLLFLASCASSEKSRKIDEEVHAESTITDGTSLSETVNELIDGARKLNEAQKAELRKVVRETQEKNRALSEESYKLRGLLMKELLSDGKTSSKIRLIQKKISKAEKERLKNTFRAADQISSIVSGNEEARMILNHFMFRDAFSR